MFILEDKYLVKKKDLKVGHLYFTGDSNICIYIGISKNDGKMLFYEICGVAMYGHLVNGEMKSAIYNDKAVFEGIRVMTPIVLRNVYIKQLLQVRTKMSNIYSVIQTDYSRELNKMLAMSKLRGIEIPCVLSEGENESNCYISRKEMRIGDIYLGTCGNSLRTYVYCGFYKNKYEAFIQCTKVLDMNDKREKDTLAQLIERYLSAGGLMGLSMKLYSRHKKILRSQKYGYNIDFDKDLGNPDIIRECVEYELNKIAYRTYRPQ